jgi:hypothetical protein
MDHAKDEVSMVGGFAAENSEEKKTTATIYLYDHIRTPFSNVIIIAIIIAQIVNHIVICWAFAFWDLVGSLAERDPPRDPLRATLGPTTEHTPIN